MERAVLMFTLKPGKEQEVEALNAEFEPLHQELLESTSAQRQKIKGLDTKRVELIVHAQRLVSPQLCLKGHA